MAFARAIAIGSSEKNRCVSVPLPSRQRALLQSSPYASVFAREAISSLSSSKVMAYISCPLGCCFACGSVRGRGVGVFRGTKKAAGL